MSKSLDSRQMPVYAADDNFDSRRLCDNLCKQLTHSTLSFQMGSSIFKIGPVSFKLLRGFSSIFYKIWQTVHTLIRGLLQEPSDLGLHCLQRTSQLVSRVQSVKSLVYRRGNWSASSQWIYMFVFSSNLTNHVLQSSNRFYSQTQNIL